MTQYYFIFSCQFLRHMRKIQTYVITEMNRFGSELSKSSKQIGIKINGRRNTIIFKNKQQIKMQGLRSPQHFSVGRGKIRSIQSHSQTKFSSVVNYSHTLRETPDEYHIEAIKQYRKELEQIKRNYEELRRLYFYLLGYRIQGDDRIPRLTFPLEKNHLCVTQVSQNGSSLRYSVSQINQAIADITDNTRKIDKLNNRLTQSIIQYKADYLKFPNTIVSKQLWKAKTKTENDEQVQDQLISALKQNQVLKDALERTRISVDGQARQIKQSYEQHIRKLEQILERERKHTKMLNGVISRMRGQLSSKDNFIRNLMKAKHSDKNGIEKVLRQLKVGI